MIGDHDDVDKVEELDDETSPDEHAGPTANVGETSVEINVEELIAELEADGDLPPSSNSGDGDRDSRKRLEQILEERRAARELEEIDEFALD